MGRGRLYCGIIIFSGAPSGEPGPRSRSVRDSARRRETDHRRPRTVRSKTKLSRKSSTYQLCTKVLSKEIRLHN
ncbi:hypothetical protein J6590_025989 [Homalodisca vitripennis]|nr:hypothetical protein J6590_025989 [Homalodisca vitripennis]